MNKITRLIIAVGLMLAALTPFATVQTAFAASPGALSGTLTVTTATVGQTVSEQLTIQRTANPQGNVLQIDITRPAGWSAPGVSSATFTDQPAGVVTVLGHTENTVGQVTTIVLSGGTGANGSVRFNLPNAAPTDALDIFFTSTPPNAPQACTAWTLATRDENNANEIAVAGVAGGDCVVSQLQTQTHHSTAASFTVTVPADGVAGSPANVALKGTARDVVLTALDSLGNVVDGANGGTAYAGTAVLTTNPDVTPTWTIGVGAGTLAGNAYTFAGADAGTATMRMNAGAGSASSTVVSTDAAVTGSSAAVVVAAPTITATGGDTGAAGESLTVSGAGYWGVQNWTLLANSLTIGGSATTHPPITVDAAGGFGDTTVTRTGALSEGSKDIVATVMDGAGTTQQYQATFTGATTINPTVSGFTCNIASGCQAGNIGTGTNTDKATLTGTGFMPATIALVQLVSASNGSTWDLNTIPATNATGGLNAPNAGFPALPEDSYTLRITDAAPGHVHDFSNTWTVGANITLDGLYPDYRDGLAGNITVIAGAAFEPNLIAGQIGIQFGTYDVTGDELLTTNAGGTLSGGALTLPALPSGAYDVIVTTPGKTRTFAGAYHVATASIGAGNGQAGQTGVSFSGSHYPANTAIGAVAVGTGTGAGFTQLSTVTGFPATTDATGNIVDVNGVSITSKLAEGSYTLRTTVGGVNFDYPNAFAVSPSVTLVPSQVVVGSATPLAVAINGFGFAAGQTILANSVTIGGQGTTHNPVAAVAADGSFAIAATLGTLPAVGRNAVAVSEGAHNHSIANAFGVM
ncbi:MAG: hypothetical protein HY784_05365, partial [Chloroflexi bacterium]|nr:hypothetical protein [Chloroflexota bacterium]